MEPRPMMGLVAALGLGVAGASFANTAMSGDAYQAEKDRIVLEHKTARGACKNLSGNRKDVCEAEARAQQRIAQADLDARYQDTPKARYDARVARAEAVYLVAKQKCGDFAGNPKDLCLEEAKVAETRAKADARADREVTEARREAAADKREAEYRVALERCDNLAGDAKDACVKNAKARFGKS